MIRAVVTRARHALAGARARLWFACPGLDPWARELALRTLAAGVSALEWVELVLEVRP